MHDGKPFASLDDFFNELNSNQRWLNQGVITYQIDGLRRSQNLGPTFQVNDAIHSMTSAQRGAAINAFQVWDDLIPIELRQSHDRNANISLNFTSDSTWKHPATSNFGRNNNNLGERVDRLTDIDNSNIWIPDTAGHTDYLHSKFLYGTHPFETFVHEIGHALGLHHAGNYDASRGTPSEDDVLFQQDSVQYSIMSYFSPAKYTSDGTVTGHLYEPSTPMLYDIVAIQAMYGYDTTTRAGNTTYGFHSSFSVAGRDSMYNFSVNDPPVMTIYDAGGNDTLDVSAYQMSQTIDLRPGFYSSVGGLHDNIAMAFNSGPDINGRSAAQIYNPNSVIENAVGGAGADLMMGNDADNKLEGRSGNDSLNGGNGNDNLDGGPGMDSMLGGAGDDTYFIDDPGDYVSEMDNLTDSGGNDTIRTNLTFYQLANDPRSEIENLTFVLPKAATGIGNYLDNVLTGNTGDDNLEGHEGNDTLVGGGGHDSLIGGVGDDTYVVSDNQAVLVEWSGEGTDQVQTRLSSYTLADNVENLYFTELSFRKIGHTGNGNALDNRIYGASLGDRLSGNDGNDFLSGGLGSDKLFGNLGNDTLRGGAGDDLLNGRDDIDTVDYSDTHVRTVIDLGQGDDAIGSAQIFKSAGTETDTLVSIENVIAGFGDDKITGSSADNVFTYSGHFNRFIKDGGSDQYDGGKGSDTVDLSKLNTNSTEVNLDEGTVVAFYSYSTDHGGGAGRKQIATLTSIENVVASRLSDQVVGNDKDNTFTYTGSFVYVGGDTPVTDSGGVDTYVGGNGNDTADFSRFVGQIYADLNTGTVSSSYHATTDGGGEVGGTRTVASLSGIENIVGTLGEDTVVGDAADNTYSYVGSYSIDSDTGGSDHFDGGGGNNTIDLSRFKNAIFVDLTFGNVSSSYTWHTDTGGGGSVRALVFFSNVLNVTGSNQGDTIRGTADANILSGLAGADTITGQGGDDRLTGGAGIDTFVFGAGFGHDTITDFSPLRDHYGRHEVLQFSTAVFADWDHLQAAITDSEQGAVITYDAGNSVTLTGVTRQQLIDNPSDFSFV